MKKIRMVDKLETHLTEDPINSTVQNTYSEIFPKTNSILALTSQIHFLTKHWCTKSKNSRVARSKVARTIFNRNYSCIPNLSAIAIPSSSPPSHFVSQRVIHASPLLIQTGPRFQQLFPHPSQQHPP